MNAQPKPLDESPFLLACRRQPVPYTPVWFMRQAGRALPEYRALRAGVPMLESCQDAALVTEITLQPVRRFGPDAAIFYSDIVVPLVAIGGDRIWPASARWSPSRSATRPGLRTLRPLERATSPTSTTPSACCWPSSATPR